MVKKAISTGKPSYEVENPKLDLDSLSTDSLEDIGKEKVDSLKVVVEEIKKLINERESLSNAVISDAEKEKHQAENNSKGYHRLK